MSILVKYRIDFEYLKLKFKHNLNCLLLVYSLVANNQGQHNGQIAQSSQIFIDNVVKTQILIDTQNARPPLKSWREKPSFNSPGLTGVLMRQTDTRIETNDFRFGQICPKLDFFEYVFSTVWLLLALCRELTRLEERIPSLQASRHLAPKMY